MASRIITFNTEISNSGEAVLRFTTEEESDIEVVFESQDIGNFAAVCAILNHSVVMYELVNDEPYFFSSNT